MGKKIGPASNFFKFAALLIQQEGVKLIEFRNLLRSGGAVKLTPDQTQRQKTIEQATELLLRNASTIDDFLNCVSYSKATKQLCDNFDEVDAVPLTTRTRTPRTRTTRTPTTRVGVASTSRDALIADSNTHTRTDEVSGNVVNERSVATNGNECIVCDKRRSIAFDPCKHCVYCKDCYLMYCDVITAKYQKEMEKWNSRGRGPEPSLPDPLCPICKAQIDKINEIILS